MGKDSCSPVCKVCGTELVALEPDEKQLKEAQGYGVACRWACPNCELLELVDVVRQWYRQP